MGAKASIGFVNNQATVSVNIFHIYHPLQSLAFDVFKLYDLNYIRFYVDIRIKRRFKLKK